MLRELFRHKLENVEITPSPDVNKELMRRLGRREFLHFNPARFNIWYAGGVAVAGAALALVLFSGQETLSKNSPVPSGIEMNRTFDPDEFKSGKVREQVQASDGDQFLRIENRRNNRGDGTIIRNNKQGQENTASGKDITSPSGIASTLPDPGLTAEASGDKNRLRNRIVRGDNMIQISVAEGCAPLNVKFRNMATAFDSCMWNFGDGGRSTLKDPQWLFDLPGEYTVTLNINLTDGSKVTSSKLITVRPGPVARFEFSPENAVLPDDEIQFINYSTDAIKYNWNFGDGSSSDQYEPRHSYRKSGNYNIRLIVISESGCSDSVTVMNAFSSKGQYIEFPNAFIPNPNGPSGGFYSPKSDEASQVFHPVSSGVSDYQLKIFSRRGIQIFESNDINIGWDGYFQGQLCESGVYIWKVRGNFTNGEPFTKMGDVTLLKN